jgi:DNA-nicking Smr family endonuclease
MSGRKLSPSESRAWARVARSIRPLRDAPPVEMDDLPGDAPAVPARPEKPARGTSAARPPASSLPSPRKTAPAQESRDRRVRRGKLEIDGKFDLHGLTQAAAERHLQGFVERQSAKGARCLLIITGKGRDGEGVLRRNFQHWLTTPAASRLVSGWAPAHARHGGGGAFYLFLRRQG